MKKKVITITLVVFALILVATLVSVAVGVGIRQKGQETATSDSYYKDSTVSAQKVYEAPDGTKRVLTYKESRKFDSADPLHYYEDSAGNQYSFDKNGELIGYQMGEGTLQSETTSAQKNNDTNNLVKEEETTSETVLSEQNIASVRNSKDAPTTPAEQILVDRARQLALATYGEEYFSKFTYSKMQVNEEINKTTILFYIRYKERIVTECCIVTLRDDKSIGNDRAMISGKGIDADFDPSLLDDIEIENLEQFAIQKLNEDYSSYQSYEIEEDIAVVRNDEGGFDLSIAVQVRISDTFGAERVKYLYPLG